MTDKNTELLMRQINPYIRKAEYHIMPPGDIVHDRVLFDYELMYIKDGEATITIEGVAYEARKGDAFIFRPGQLHSICVSRRKPVIQPHVHFDLIYEPGREDIPINYKTMDKLNKHELNCFTEDILDYFISPFPSVVKLQSAKHIEVLLVNLASTFANPDTPWREIELKHQFMQIWTHLLNEITWQMNNSKKNTAYYLNSIKNYLDYNSKRVVSLGELEKITYLSKNYICRIFRKQYHISPIQYHTGVRLNMAKEMIRFTNLSLTEISNELGFENIQSFSRVFKRSEGISPSEYRDKIEAERLELLSSPKP